MDELNYDFKSLCLERISVNDLEIKVFSQISPIKNIMEYDLYAAISDRTKRFRVTVEIDLDTLRELIDDPDGKNKLQSILVDCFMDEFHKKESV